MSEQNNKIRLQMNCAVGKSYRFIVKKSQMLEKMMDRFCKLNNLIRSNVQFNNRGRQIREYETGESAHLVEDDIIDVVVLGKINASVLYELIYQHLNILIDFWKDGANSESHVTSVPTKSSDTVQGVGIKRNFGDVSASNNQMRPNEVEPSQSNAVLANNKQPKHESIICNEMETDTESNAAKIARLKQSVESFLTQICETGTFEIHNQIGSETEVDTIEYDAQTLMHSQSKPNDTEKNQQYEAKIRSLLEQCENDKNQYMAGLKASTERQAGIVKSMEEQFDREKAELKADKLFYISELETMKHRLNDQSLQRACLSQMQNDFFKNDNDDEKKPTGLSFPQNYLSWVMCKEEER